jgi:hypothetical protein
MWFTGWIPIGRAVLFSTLAYFGLIAVIAAKDAGDDTLKDASLRGS